jgi:hypothetical protein
MMKRKIDRYSTPRQEFGFADDALPDLTLEVQRKSRDLRMDLDICLDICLVVIQSDYFSPGLLFCVLTLLSYFQSIVSPHLPSNFKG